MFFQGTQACDVDAHKPFGATDQLAEVGLRVLPLAKQLVFQRIAGVHQLVSQKLSIRESSPAAAAWHVYPHVASDEYRVMILKRL